VWGGESRKKSVIKEGEDLEGRGRGRALETGYLRVADDTAKN